MLNPLLKFSLLCAALLFFSQPALADEAKGRELINSLGCKGCHQFEGSGGTFGPSLDGVGKRLNDSQLRQKLIDPKADNPNSAMPSYKQLPEGDLKVLVETLHSLK